VCTAVVTRSPPAEENVTTDTIAEIMKNIAGAQIGRIMMLDLHCHVPIDFSLWGALQTEVVVVSEDSRR